MEVYKQSKAAEMKEHMKKLSMKQHERMESIDKQMAHKAMKGL